MTEQVGEKQKSKAKATDSAKASTATKRAQTVESAPSVDTVPGTGTASATGATSAPSKVSATGAASASSKTPATGTTSAVSKAPATVTPSATSTAPGSGFETRHAVLRYTTLRLALFLVALVLVWAVALVFHMDLSSQLSKLTLLAVALLLSSAASFIVLTKQRDAMSAGIVARTQRLSKKFDDAASFEDDEE